MDIKELRKADLITSIIITAFGLFVIYMATQMPMSSSYGGVESTWYVAPALFPLFIGSVLTILGIILFAIAVQAGALHNKFSKTKEELLAKSNQNARVWITALAFAFLIYIYIPNFDFTLCLSIFLFAVIGSFYPDNNNMIRGVFGCFAILTVILGILTTATGIIDQETSINNFPDSIPYLSDLVIEVFDGNTANIVPYLKAVLFAYTGDLLLIAGLIGLIVYTYKIAKKNNIKKKMINLVLIVSIVFPLVICPIFRYPLRTNLPLEGIIISEIMHSVRALYQNYTKEQK